MWMYGGWGQQYGDEKDLCLLEPSHKARRLSLVCGFVAV